MKNLLIFAVILGLYACDDGSSGDPSTNDLGEFNPPGQLASLTRDGALNLTWVGANAEDDFQGYHVFGTTSTIDELQALIEYPESASDNALNNGQSIPRCVDNSAFFEAFGFPATEAECESSVIPDEDDGIFLNGRSMGFIQDDEEEETTDEEEEDSEEELTINFNVPCVDDEGATIGDGTLSVAATDGKTLGRVFCEVNKVWDGSELAAIANGTTYTYMVVAVKGGDKNQISWISNVIDDTPVNQLFADTIALKGGSDAQFVVLPIDSTDFGTTEAPEAQDCTNAACRIGSTNGEATNGIYIARDSATGGSFEFSQRLFISTNSGSDLTLQYRGADVFEDTTGDETVYQPELPGGTASTGTYLAEGKKFIFNERAKFDFKADLGDSTNRYGRISITNLSYAAADETDSTVTLDVTIAIQPQVDQVHTIREDY